MLFMFVGTWEPWATKELQERVTKKGFILPEGIKFSPLWADWGGNRVFCMFETDDIKPIQEVHLYYNDLMKVETFPVVEVEMEVIKR